MAVDVAALAEDLAAQTASLTAMLDGLSEAAWHQPTPAAGWDVLDQVTHLAFWDEIATLAATDPARFETRRQALVALGPDFVDVVARQSRDRTGAQALAWFTRTRGELLTALLAVPPDRRLPWFGPPMSAASSLSARLMETWAHGQDVADTLGLDPAPTARLRHIAHLGVVTIGWAFTVHGRPRPAGSFRVELSAPDGALWTWGPADARNVVRGPAQDFCLLVTQRRHHRDLALTATGADAAVYLEIAQVFAGPPGSGRAPNRVPAEEAGS
ncbi:TIGR03084 family protein [Frankia sp. AgB1.9]|uniref:TIGR03084 family metal-binding protein n=1 Tax=unclassified Frankia TaxID=2632575 RepID=UPI0019342F8B|nr:MULTISPECIES: TIGR03084 family metal-binding protein [unclassified Frankia]MBL7486848.1 TIGR03084 family protein [Frankia sp. AgW1.1]MBL7549779.1 TIGR03084 family protein [Frankia sp. AgB1.9]MBL7622911.1 TIGR03084 family protein [Frankia sp. AgB1.8]